MTLLWDKEVVSIRIDVRRVATAAVHEVDMDSKSTLGRDTGSNQLAKTLLTMAYLPAPQIVRIP